MKQHNLHFAVRVVCLHPAAHACLRFAEQLGRAGLYFRCAYRHPAAYCCGGRHRDGLGARGLPAACLPVCCMMWREPAWKAYTRCTT